MSGEKSAHFFHTALRIYHLLLTPDWPLIRPRQQRILALILCVGMSLNPAVYFFLTEPGAFHSLREGENAVLNKRRIVCQRRFLAAFLQTLLAAFLQAFLVAFLCLDDVGWVLYNYDGTQLIETGEAWSGDTLEDVANDAVVYYPVGGDAITLTTEAASAIAAQYQAIGTLVPVTALNQANVSAMK